MPKLLARGTITISKMDDVYEIKLAPWTVAIPTNADGSNPVLSSAKTRLVVNKDNVVISTTITSLTTKNCTATFVGNEVSITSLSADSGEVQINFNVEDQQRIAVFTWTKAKQGNAGTDAYTVSLSNESHTIPATSAGVVTAAELDKATSIISAWKGSTPLSAVAANAAPGVGQFRYNITGAVGCSAVRVNNSQFKLSAMTADSATVTLSIIVEGVQTIEKVMTISKAKAGQDGGAGAPGVQGPALVPRGAYAANKTYVGTATNIDVVKFNNIWYKAKANAGTFTGIAPTGHAQSAAKWETFGADFESIATDVFFASESTIENLIATKFRTGTSGVRVEINMNGDGAIRAFNASNVQTFAVVNGKLAATDVDLTGKINANSGQIGALKIDNDGLYADVGGYGSLKLTSSLLHMNYNALVDQGIVRSVKIDYANTNAPLLELNNIRTGSGSSANPFALSIRGGIQIKKGNPGPGEQIFTAFTGSFQDYIGNHWRVENGLICGYL